MNEEFEKDRQAFEAWAVGDHYDVTRLQNEYGNYKSYHTHTAWVVWQASRKQAVEECARIAENQYQVWDEGIAAGNEIATAIRAMQKD